jgi:tRNA (guanine-N7-)-methyltransferase
VRRGPRLPLEEMAPYLLEVPDPPVPFNWPDVFGNAQDVVIEVGFGKGLFLVTAATANSETNFLGIEIERKHLLFTANRIATRKLTNVRLVRADGRLFLRDCVPPQSVHAMHVYFPDPWWKKRHHKRRLFTAEFADECQRVLCVDGFLHVATDVEAYFHVICDLLRQKTHLLMLPPLPPKVPANDLDYLTNFERKSLQQGRPVYKAVYQRISVI